MFRDEWDALDIAYDDFIRTTEPRHHKAVQEFLQRIYDAGDIELGTYEGLYCVSCEAYYAEDELVRGNCPIHDRPVEHVTEENYFFKLSRYEDRLLEHYAAHPGGGAARHAPQRGARVHPRRPAGLLDEPHVDLVGRAAAVGSEARRVRVGRRAVQLLHRGRATREDRERFAKWWPVDYHLIGKDILRFHAVYWPAMLMSAGLAPPRCVFAHGWLLVGGEKMSKTKLNQIAPADLVAEFGVDGFRYHFMADQRFGPDGDFSYEAMVQRYNADLANNFGNLANRVLNMAVNYCGGVVPDTRENGPLAARVGDGVRRHVGRDAASRLCVGASASVWDLIRAANAFIEDRAPWALNKAGDTAAVAGVLGDCLETLRIVALLASPVIPNASAELWRRLGLPGRPEDATGAGRGGVGAACRPARSSRRASRCSREKRPSDSRGSTRTAICSSSWARRGSRSTKPTRRWSGRARRESSGWCAWVPGSRPRGRRSSSRRDTTTCTRPSVCIRTTRRNSTPSGTGSRRWRDAERCVAIGEVGFDLLYEHSPRDEQEVAFRRHIAAGQGG